jgi:hypothetical protein
VKRVSVEKVCNFWVQGNCSFGDKCRYLHSWSLGDGFSLVTQLEGHQKVEFFCDFVGFFVICFCGFWIW